jgi:hypothetical protein
MSKRSLVATLSFLGLAVSSISSLAADPMGSVVAVEGRPTATGTGGSRALSAGSSVFEGDTVTVGSGNAQMELDDGTKLVVGPSSRLVLQSYLRRNQTTAKKVGIKALRGTFRVITGNSPKSAYNISTSNATIGVRGTGFDITVDSRTLLAVLEGEVKLRGNNGQSVITASGCGVAEAGASKVIAQELDGKPKSDALQNELPYITDQSGLAEPFQLPVANCLPFILANSGAGPAIPPAAALIPIIPGVIIGNEILNKDDPVSQEVTPQIIPGIPPYCDSKDYPVPCRQ